MFELLQAMGLAQANALPARTLPVLFVHANKDLELALLQKTAQLWHAGRFETIVLNGMTVAECRDLKINYAGLESWKQWLVQEGGVAAAAIRHVKPGRHTYEEAHAIHLLCAKEGWSVLAFLSFPYHILRCTLTQLAAMKRLQCQRQLYPLSLEAVEWFEPVTKQLLGGETFTRPRLDMFAEEWQRIQKYQEQGDCVSLPEMLAFFKQQGEMPPESVPSSAEELSCGVAAAKSVRAA